MTRPTSTARRLLSVHLMLVVLLFSLPGTTAVAQSFGERRVHVGLKLFRTLVAADTESGGKLDGGGRLPVYLAYADNRRDAREYASELAADMDTVRGAPVRIEVVSLASLLTAGDLRPAAVFITQPLDDRELVQLVDYAIRRRVILFSPFEGDVEKGVLGGISVEATIRPLINVRTLRSSGLAIRNFYLRVARRYGDGED
ncbi:MAG: hypothetical protein KDH15_17260 [Rhodocyclaceae bacterium]|nr:hypothetical protein [Rhodocyclaceae bacterium]